ncbi:MAG TPA: hypothetical protein VGO91_04935 [Pyrinomonadaceae bacterium]|nr:hypothetical protein [Pyrinomonadaceae bacterium]
MRLHKPRTAVSAFALAFILGVAVYYTLPQWRTLALAQQQEKAASPVQQEQSVPAVAEHKATPKQFVRYGPLKGFSGYADTDTESVTLRESPRRDAHVVAKVKTGSYRGAQILDSTPDFLRVRFTADADLDAGNEGRDYEGWAAWGDVFPSAVAIVLDTATGQVVSRLPLPDQADEGNPSYAVAFSPDGAHAIFYSLWSSDACEVNTDDYRPRRSLLMSGLLQPDSMFYGPVDGELYVVARAGNNPRLDENTGLNVLRVGTLEAEEPARELSGAASGFVVSRDGRTGFITHQAEDGASINTLDVVDLETMLVRNTLTLESASQITWPGMIVTNRDGSKLYTLESDKEGQQVISVIETRTGKHVRDLKISDAETGWEGLTPDSIVGDSIFTRVWNQEAENSPPRGMWLDVNGRVNAEHGIAYAIEAGDTRFGIDQDGTQLFRLDEKNRIHERFKIERPELKQQPGMMHSLGIYGMTASPDGKRLIIFIGQIDGC